MKSLILLVILLIVGCIIFGFALTCVNLNLIRHVSLRDVPMLVFEYAVWLIFLVLLVLFLTLVLIVFIEFKFRRLLF